MTRWFKMSPAQRERAISRAKAWKRERRRQQLLSSPPPEILPCKWCYGPVTPRRHYGKKKLFCSANCKASYYRLTPKAKANRARYYKTEAYKKSQDRYRQTSRAKKLSQSRCKKNREKETSKMLKRRRDRLIWWKRKLGKHLETLMPFLDAYHELHRMTGMGGAK